MKLVTSVQTILWFLDELITSNFCCAKDLHWYKIGSKVSTSLEIINTNYYDW